MVDISKPIVLTLFHLHGCGHCVDFMNDWNKMKNTKEASKNMSFKIYEHSDLNKINSSEYIINGKPIIDGYPTLKITINNNNYVYDGRDREPESIYKFILNKLRGILGVRQ